MCPSRRPFTSSRLQSTSTSVVALAKSGVGHGGVAHVTLAAVAQRIVAPELGGQGIRRGRQVAILPVDQLRAEHQHHGGLPPAAVRVVGEGLALGLRERPAERALHVVQEAAIAKAPGEVAAEGGHGHAVAARHDGRRLVERGQMRRPGVAVGDQKMAEARAGQRRSVVDEDVAHHALAHRHRAHGLEGEGAEVEGGGEHGAPSRALGDQPTGDQLREVARGEGVHAERQVGAVLLQRAHGDDHQGARAVERVESRHRHLFETIDAHTLLPSWGLPFVAAR